MKFQFSQKFISSRKSSPFICAAGPVVVSIIFVTSAFINSKEQGLFLLVIFTAICTIFFRKAFISLKHWNENSQNFLIEILPDQLIAHDRAGKEITLFESIEKVTVQSSRNSVKSIIIKAVNGREGKLEGLENMDKLTKEIEKHIDPKNITYRRYLHR